MNSQVQKLIGYALSQVGYQETPKGSNKNKFSEFIDKNFPDFYNGKKNGYAAWCDIFVDACFLECFGEDETLRLLCQPKKSCGAGCKFSYNYFKSAKRSSDKPEIGDQIFFYVGNDINHTGIVYKVDDKKVYTVEGNSGDEVKKHSYSLENKKIAGYGRPDWKENDQDVTVQKPIDEKPEIIKPNNSDVYYSVKKGDTLYGIAKRFGTTVQELQSINKIANPKLIYPYQKILLPSGCKDSGESKEEPKKNTFIGKVNTIKYPLNVRSGAGSSYKIIKTLPKGSAVELYSDTINGWYKLADGSGFVAGNYIVKM